MISPILYLVCFVLTMGRGPKWTQEQIDELTAAFADGQTPTQFCKEHPSLSYQTVKKYYRMWNHTGLPMEEQVQSVPEPGW
jgi:hypothetical protein